METGRKKDSLCAPLLGTSGGDGRMGGKKGEEKPGICGLGLLFQVVCLSQGRPGLFLPPLVSKKPQFSPPHPSLTPSLTPLTSESHLKAPPNPKSHQNSILVLPILLPLFSQQTGSAKIKRTIRKAWNQGLPDSTPQKVLNRRPHFLASF